MLFDGRPCDGEAKTCLRKDVAARRLLHCTAHGNASRTRRTGNAQFEQELIVGMHRRSAFGTFEPIAAMV